MFVGNNSIPIFDDAEITQLYKRVYIEKQGILKQLENLNAKIAEIEVQQLKLTAKFNYKPLLKMYDLSTIAQSPIQYYEAAQGETIGAFSQMALKLNAQYIENPHLTPEENSLFRERQKFLAAWLELGLDDVKAHILQGTQRKVDFFVLNKKAIPINLSKQICANN